MKMNGMNSHISSGRANTPPKTSWFEILLDPSFLGKHLAQEDPDPSPIDLIIQFLANAAIPQNRDTLSTVPPMIAGLGESKVESIDLTFDTKNGGNDTKKTQALKLLALSVAAYLNWNLDVLENQLPLPMQNTLLSDFLKLTLEGEKTVDSKRHLELDLASLPDQALFALLLYHRWVVRAILLDSFPTKPPKVVNVQLPGQQVPTVVPPIIVDALMKMLHETWADSQFVLEKLSDVNKDILMPSMETFHIPTEMKQAVEHDWNTGTLLSAIEIQCQVCYDLGCMYFFREEYANAGEMFFKVQDLVRKLKETKFCKINIPKLEGYLKACSSILHRKLENIGPSLEEQLQLAIDNGYEGLIELLMQDNKTKELSKSYRLFLEQQIQLEAAENKKLYSLRVQVAACNVVREILEGVPVVSLFLQDIATNKHQELRVFLETVRAACIHANMQQRAFLKNFLSYVCMCCNESTVPLLTTYNLTSLFTKEELAGLADVSKIPEPEPEPYRKEAAGSQALLVGELERKLLASYDGSEIRRVIQQLYNSNARKPLWKINMMWEIPNPVLSTVLNSCSGFLQDYIYILVAKSRELTKLKSFNEARNLLELADRESLAPKLSRMMQWETVFIDLLQLQDNPSLLEKAVNDLSKKCKTCITALQQDVEVLPRIEIIEHSCAFLLTSQNWDFLASIEGSRSSQLEFASILAKVCIEVSSNNSSRKAAKELWERILPIFSNYGSQPKRSTNNIMQWDIPHSILSKATLNQFLEKVQNITALSIMISCLAKLHNILKDDSNNNLFLEYASPWPAVVSNASAFYSKPVYESLSSLLHHALQLFPYHPPFLKTMADLNYVLGFHGKCLKYYLEAGAVCSNFFTQPVPRPVFDDQVYKRLIRCCSQLMCHTQAAVLCQFLEEVDYPTAFKALQEKNCCDAMDACYNYIWDITILEFLVNLHTKKGEVDKKQLVLKVMGQLELNCNNNDEIKREAANVRKSQFLRALTEQIL